MTKPLKDIRGIPPKVSDWANGHGILKEARKLCREYLEKYDGKNGLNEFAAKNVKVRFVRQVLVFREGPRSSPPSVETSLALDVFGGLTSIGTFTLVSKLNGHTEYAGVHIDASIRPGMDGTGAHVQDVQFKKDRFSVSLLDGRTISVPYMWYPELLNASRRQRTNWEVWERGDGISWPEIDFDIGTDELLRTHAAPPHVQ